MSHNYTSNADQIGRQMAEQVRSFDFTATEEGKSLGLLVAENIAHGIEERSAQDQSAPSTGPWPRNRNKEYRIWKLKNFNRVETNFCSGWMLRFDALLGNVTVAPELVTLEYGTGEVGPFYEQEKVSRESGRSAKAPSNKKIHAAVSEPLTDVDLAYYAHTQGRGFYELDDKISQQNFEIIGTALGNFMRTTAR